MRGVKSHEGPAPLPLQPEYDGHFEDLSQLTRLDSIIPLHLFLIYSYARLHVSD
jgi:hypothetical protein